MSFRPPIPLFPSVEAELEYLEKEGLDAARIDVLETHGRYVEAADVHVLKGRVIEAIQCCLKNQEDETTFRHTVNIILDVLWKKCTFAVSARKALKNGTSAAHVLELALNLSQDRLDASEKDQVRWHHCNLCMWHGVSHLNALDPPLSGTATNFVR